MTRPNDTPTPPPSSLHPPSERVARLVEKIRAFVDAEILPLEPRLLAEGPQAIEGEIATLREHAKALGLWAPHLPEDLGGLGLSLEEVGRVSEELGRSPIGHLAVNCQAPDVGNMEILHAFGTPEQKERFLAPLARGEIRSCFAMTEPENAGSNPLLLEGRAVRDGDDYVIDAHKWFTSSADGAAFAIAMVVTDPEAANPYRRASQILVPTDTPGFTRVRNIPIFGDVGAGWFSHAEVRFENCRVPRANLLGGEGEGFAIAQERLGPGRIHHCMRWIGICERVFDMMCERAARREIAPGKPLGSRQSVQHGIAESRAEIHASRLMVLDAARKIDQFGAKAAREEISIIKFWVAGVLLRILDRAVQIHGALGVTDDTILSFWYRHERGARIYDGPDEVHKNVVARRALRRFGVDVGR